MKKSKKHNSIKVDKGRILETSFGTYMAYMRSNGKRYRKCFDTFTGAEQYLLSLAEQDILPPLSSTQLQDARIAFNRLPPNINLRDVVDYYLSHRVVARKMNLSELVQKYLGYNHLKPITIRNHEAYLRRLSLAMGDKDISLYTTEEINSLVKQYSLSTQRKCLSILSAWFTFAVKQKWLEVNPCETIPKPHQAEIKIRIYSIEETQKILDIVEAKFPRLVWYFAVGLFAGIRPYEIQRLTTANFVSGYIYLDGSITKTASTRTVTITPNLQQWLDVYPVESIDSNELMQARVEIRKHIDVIHDGMRHSYASYSYERTKDAALVASELGHRGTAMFFRHYRALAAPGSGEKFFCIVPKKRLVPL